MRLGLDRSNTRKYVLSMGMEPFKVRTVESKNQPTLALSVEDADAVVQNRTSQGFSLSDPSHPDVEVPRTDDGVFYLLVPDPELRPSRFKCGFTNSLVRRMRDYRSCNPEAHVALEYPCERSWEPAVLALVKQHSDEWIAQELFEGDIAELQNKIGQFFVLLRGSESARGEKGQ